MGQEEAKASELARVLATLDAIARMRLGDGMFRCYEEDSARLLRAMAADVQRLWHATDCDSFYRRDLDEEVQCSCGRDAAIERWRLQ